MDQNPIDQEMDALLERLSGKKGFSSNAYGSDPLASDHLLLRQSWGFFKRRVASIEQQWREITEAKSEEIVLLKKQVSAMQERLHDLEMERTSSEDFLRAAELSRLEDHESFRKEKDHLIHRWEEERIALEADRRKLEHDLKRKDERLVALELSLQKAKKEQEAIRTAAQETESKWIQSQAEISRSLNESLVDKDNLFQSEQLKTELLRREVERRDQLLAESSARELGLLARVKGFEAELLEGKTAREKAETDLTREREDAKRLGAERTRLLEDWQREKAEWRELWDRSRSTSEKRSS